MKIKIAVGIGLVVTCLVLIILLQASETKRAEWKSKAETAQKLNEGHEKRATILEKQDLERVVEEDILENNSIELKGKIDEAVKELKEEDKTVRPTTLAIDCARLLRSKQTNSPKYKSLCL